MKIKIKGIMGELLRHMWLLGLPCSLGGDEWLRDNIFYLFIRFSLMNKNRKCGWDHSITPLVKKMQPLVQTLKNLLFSQFRYKVQRYFFYPSTLIFNWGFLKRNWTDINVWHMALFHTFSKYFFAAVFFEFRYNPPQVHPHLQWRVRSFLPA